jgi:hypothetical protein
MFTRLCGAYSRNLDATLTAEDLGAGIPNDIFAAALRELRGPADDQDPRLSVRGRQSHQGRAGHVVARQVRRGQGLRLNTKPGR